MKKRLFMIWVALAAIATSTQAQVAINATNFPDENFRNWLLNAENISGYGADGQLTAEEIAGVKEINVNGKEIKNLKGIEHFTALEILYCGTNQLTSLDVTKNQNLTGLYCYQNQLTSLDVTKNTALEYLMIQYNQIKTIDLSKNLSLKMLFVTGNPLTALDTSMLANLEQLLGGKQDLSILQLANNKKLSRLDFTTAEWPNIDLSLLPSLTSLSLESMNLTSIDVSMVPTLESLSVGGNQLTTIDVSKNPKLKSLYCPRNQLTAIDLSNNPELETLTCGINQLTALDLSKTPKLKSLYCSDNQLTTLDLSQNPIIERIECYKNHIRGAGLDALISSLPIIPTDGYGWLDFLNEEAADGNDMTSNQLTAAKVKRWYTLYYDVATKRWDYYFGPARPDVAINATNFPDENFRNWVLAQDYGKDGVLTDDEVLTIDGIIVEQLGIKDLTGINHFRALRALWCAGNELTSLDVSGLEFLWTLYCNDNQLTTVDLSHNYELSVFGCGENQITTLDFSNNPKLSILNIWRNQISEAEMEKLVNSLPALPNEGLFYALNLSYGREQNVMNSRQVAVAKAKNWKVTARDVVDHTVVDFDYEGSEPTISASVAINATNFPDENFRNWLLDSRHIKGYGEDGVLTEDEIADIKEIDVTDNEIKDLTGIGYFTALETLYCGSNQLTTLDLSNNPELGWLECQYNQLTTLDLSKNPHLGTLKIVGNPFTYVDLSVVPYLSQFVCGSQDVSVIDFSKNERMRLLYCTNADLTHLDVTVFPRLEYLVCSGLKLTSLDLSKNPKLYHVDCAKNQLTTLDLSNNPAITEVYCNTNNISGAGMDALVSSLPTVSKGELRVYDNDYNNEANEMTTVQVAAAKAKGWNPTYYDGSDRTWKDYEGVPVPGLAIDATNFPDENFRNFLLAQEYGADAVLTDEEIAGIKEINVGGMKIKDLKGIEYFTALEVLSCIDNQLSALDLSKNTQLAWLDCDDNSGITALDLSKNTELSILYCGSLQLTSIDLSKNTKLTVLGVSSDKLTSLDISMLPELELLFCSGNMLTSLDVSRNPKLEQLTCYGNQLKTLDLSKNPSLTLIQCWKNQIRGIWMEAMVSSLPTVSNGKLQVCREETSEGNEMSSDQVAAARAKGWNPLYYDVTSTSWMDYEGVTGIEGVKMDGADSGSWYTLDGRKLQGKPAQKGVYILNGRKTVLK